MMIKTSSVRLLILLVIVRGFALCEADYYGQEVSDEETMDGSVNHLLLVAILLVVSGCLLIFCTPWKYFVV